MLAGGIVFAAYGFWVLMARLPGHLSAGVRIGASLWAVAVFTAMGMLIAAFAAGLALMLSRPVSTKRRVATAAAIETTFLTLVLIWLLLNEFTYAMTSQVLGRETLMMIWSIPAAVFEGAWEMGGRYLILTGILGLAGIFVLYRLTARSLRPRSLEQTAPSPETNRVPRRRGFGTGFLARVSRLCPPALLVIAAVFAIQLCGKPSKALTVVLRSSPPLRAMNLTRILVGVDLAGPRPEHFGSPVVSEPEFQASMGKPRQPAPNVILILLESVPAKALHCYGYPRGDVSPNMDAMAAEGILFEHCVSPASFSTYSLVSIMTSLYMLRGNYNDHFADASFPFMSLPRFLKLAGYELAIFSSGNEAFDKINHFYPPADFDTYFSHDTWGEEKADCMRMDDRHAVGRFEQWISSRKTDRPFYCSFYLQSTHFNYEVPEPWFSYYKPVPPLYSNGDGIIHIPPKIVPLLKNQYDNSMRYSDYWAGRIRDALAKAGQLDNSIIVFVGDHGEAFMEHGLARHGVQMWEEMIHVPLIMYLGRSVRQSSPTPPPSRFSDSVSGIDIAPTIAGIVGLKAFPGWQGVNLLAPGYGGRDRPVFSVLQLTQTMEAVCLDKYKYVYNLTDVETSLYNLRTDPDERENLVDREPQRTAALHAMLAAWHTRQLAYYSPSNRPFKSYIGQYEPSPDLLAAFHNGTKPQGQMVSR